MYTLIAMVTYTFTCCILNIEKPYELFSDPHLSQLAVALQVYSSDLNESGLDRQTTLNHIKGRIKTHIQKKLEEGLSKETITKQLTDLTMNALIPMDINDWCYDKLDEIAKELNHNNCIDEPITLDDDNPATTEPLPPLFSKDTVYHASLCALFVSQSQLDLSMYGHSFDQISLSVSDQNKLLVANQGNIVYTSFHCNSDEYTGHIIESKLYKTITFFFH